MFKKIREWKRKYNELNERERIDLLEKIEKMSIKLLGSLIVIFIIKITGTYVHELSHALMFELVGGESKGIEVGLTGGVAKGNSPDAESFRLVAIAGSLGAILFGVCIIIAGHNFNNYTITIGGYLVILSNIEYWLFYKFYEMSDCQLLIDSYESFNPEPLMQLLWIFYIITFLLLISSIYKIYQNKKWRSDYYGKIKA